MIGLGTDILEIARIREAIEEQGDRFIQRLFTKREQAYCSKHNDPIPHYAARFSAKESIVKALGSGFGEKASWLDIEIVNDAQGKPEVFFSETLKRHFNDPHVLLTMSHCKNYATAVAVRLK